MALLSPSSDVLVHVRGGGKTEMIHCKSRNTVRELREGLGVPLGVGILLVPAHRELDDQMQLGEIVREGHMTMEVRCQGVGGGLFSWLFSNKYDNEALRHAAAEGNLEWARHLLAAGASVNARNPYGMTPLHESAHIGCVEMSQMLIEAGANVNATDTSGLTPLHSSAFKYLKGSQMLVGAGANVNAVDHSGMTPLHVSAINGSEAVSEMLIGSGATINAADKKGKTPLHRSARNDWTEVSQMLIGAGANVNATDNEVHPSLLSS